MRSLKIHEKQLGAGHPDTIASKKSLANLKTVMDEVASTPLVRAESVSDLTDEEIVALTELQMEPRQDVRLSELLDLLDATLRERQQAGNLTESERPELQSLMQIYQEGMVRKAAAQAEAVIDPTAT
jgi:hypothetical protein